MNLQNQDILFCCGYNQLVCRFYFFKDCFNYKQVGGYEVIFVCFTYQNSYDLFQSDYFDTTIEDVQSERLIRDPALTKSPGLQDSLMIRSGVSDNQFSQISGNYSMVFYWMLQGLIIFLISMLKPFQSSDGSSYTSSASGMCNCLLLYRPIRRFSL